MSGSASGDDPRGTNSEPGEAQVAGFKSEWWPASRRNGGRHQIGIGGRIRLEFAISDGIESRDAYFSQSSMDVSLCTAVKNKGFQIAVVEIKYPKLVSNSLYADTVLPVETTISPAMQQCASPGWYFQAVNNADVPAKFLALKDQIMAGASRLTQSAE